MFGGICYMYKGYMIAGTLDEYLFLRLGEKRTQQALDDCQEARLFDLTGRPMKSIIQLPLETVESDQDLLNWLLRAMDFIDTDPPPRKSKKKRRIRDFP